MAPHLVTRATAVLAPHVATPHDVVERMLDIAGVGPGDFVYDLGCGDGRIAIAAAQRSARAFGCDIEPYWVDEARRLAAESGVAHLATFEMADALAVDLSEATVVALYLVDWSTRKLEPKLRAELRPGARVVSHSFAMESEAERTERFQDLEGTERTIRLWTVDGPGDRGAAAVESTRPSRPASRDAGDSMEIAELTLERLRPFVGSTFEVALPEPWNLHFVLAEASPLAAMAAMAAPPGAIRAPFRLIFRGPASPIHPQSILPLEHETLGRIEIFLVPIGPDAAGMRYEAIFT